MSIYHNHIEQELYLEKMRQLDWELKKWGKENEKKNYIYDASLYNGRDKHLWNAIHSL